MGKGATLKMHELQKKIMENQRMKENRSKGRKEGKESSKEEGTKSQCDI